MVAIGHIDRWVIEHNKTGVVKRKGDLSIYVWYKETRIGIELARDIKIPGAEMMKNNSHVNVLLWDCAANWYS